MQSLRFQRVRELLKREIGEILRRDFPLDQNGMLSVNDVLLSNDLKAAKIYVGIVGSQEQKDNAKKLLSQNRGAIQNAVAQNVVLKYTPHLQLILDDSIERGNRVLKILEELEGSEPAE